MNNEFKKVKLAGETRFVLEFADGGATSSGSIASVEKPLGELQRRSEPQKPRNFVAKNAKMGGAGAHKDKKKAVKQGDVKHKNKQMDTVEGSLNELSKDTLKSYSKERGATIHADQRDASGARDMAADKKKHGDTKAAADWDDEASWLDKRAEKGAKGVAQATTKIAKKGVAEDHEIQMASSELQSIAKNAVHLLDLVRKYSEQQGLDAWQQSKITKAADYLNAVLQSVSGEQTPLEGYGSNRGYHHGFASPTAPRLGSRPNHGDDERHDLDDPELKQNRQETTYYNITIDGKPLNPKPIFGRNATIAWGREQVAAGVDLSNAMISPVKYTEDAYMESLMNMLERSVSQAQHNLMVGVAHNPAFAQKVKVKRAVGQEFANADQGHDISKLPIRVPKKK